MRVEFAQILDALAQAHEADRDPELSRDSYDYSTLRRAVEFREDRSGQTGRLTENFCLAKRVLAGGRIEHEPDLMRRAGQLTRDDAAHLSELFHQIGLGLQASRGIDENGAGLARNRRRDRIESDRRRIGALLLLDDFRARAIAPDLQLLDVGGAKSIA